MYQKHRGANSSTSDGDWYAYATNKYVPNDLEAAASAFNQMNRYKPSNTVGCANIEYKVEQDGEFVLGLKKTEVVNNDWTVVNDFQLLYYGGGTGSAIRDVRVNVQEDDKVYDLTGRRVDADHLHKGVYIRKGQKIQVK